MFRVYSSNQPPPCARPVDQSTAWRARRIWQTKGAGVTRDNVKRLLLLTGAREVHVGSACQEHVPRTVPLPAAAVSLGFVSEGA